MTGLDRVNDKQLPVFPWVRSEHWGGPQRYHFLGGGCVSGRAANGRLYQMAKDSGVTETWLQAASRKARRLAL